jgi:hypothetical protein
MRHTRQSAGNRRTKADNTGEGHGLHRRSGCHQTYGLGDPGPGQMCAIQAQRHTATLRRARPDIIIEIRWCRAHKGVPGNEKAYEWAKLAAEEPDARGVEWLQGGTRPMPLPRSLAHFKREISEKKWTETRRWAGDRVSQKK